MTATLSSLLAAALLPQGPAPQQLAKDYTAAIEAANRAHADRPVATSERELADKLPASAGKLVAELAQAANSPATLDALATAAAAALDLDRVADFERLRAAAGVDIEAAVAGG